MEVSPLCPTSFVFFAFIKLGRIKLLYEVAGCL